MTVREAFENCLIELNKVQAPALLVDDFIYLFNKTIQKYINKRYNEFEKTQQLTDDLRVLLRTVEIKLGTGLTNSSKKPNVFGTNFTCELPDDYLHILNCICRFKHGKDKCSEEDYYIEIGANKLGTNEWSHVIDNYYMKPSERRPYYYINNISDPAPNGVIGNRSDKTVGNRYGNSSIPVMQIKCGNGNLQSVFVDYLRAPKYYSLNQDQLDDVIDQTEILEFPDYVNYEIINELVTLMLENGKDPRLQSFIGTQSSIPQISFKK